MLDNVLFRVGRALTNTEIGSLYALAEKHKVSICLWKNTPSPAKAASTWAASGKARHIIPFLLRMRKYP